MTRTTLARCLALSTATVLLLAGCAQDTPEKQEPTAPAARVATPTEVPDLTWKPCQDKDLKGLECATLEVPMDADKPDLGTATLALSRRVHRGDKSRGVLVALQGGPGLPGRGLPLALSEMSDVISSYDIVAFDPRGVGASTPTVACDSKQGRQPDAEPTTPAGLAAWDRVIRSYVDSCVEKTDNPALLEHMSTYDVAIDVDTIRRALGADKVTTWGTSYGTYLGQMHASLFPDTLDKMLLDSVVDPAVVWPEFPTFQAAAIEGGLTRFYEYLAAHPQSFSLGSTADEVAQKVTAARERLGRSPLGPLTQEKFDAGLTTASYGVHLWPIIGMGLDQVINDHEGRYFEFSPAPDADPWPGWLGVVCGQTDFPTLETMVEEAKPTARKAPMRTWGSIFWAAPCTVWPTEPGPEPEITGTTQAPILLVSETYDAASPISGAYAARRTFPTASLVEGKDGVTHSSATGATGCLGDVIDDFMRDGTVPKRIDGDNVSDARCPGVKAPEPLKH